MAENLERLKQRIPLLEYLQRHNWKPCRAGARQEFVGLCPLHQEIRHALAATRHLLEMYRRQLSDGKASRRLQRLDRRLLDVDQALRNIAMAQN